MDTKSITLKCRAKINLSLDVTGRRENGYHDVELIFCEIPLHDTLTVSLREDGEIKLSCDDASLPTDEKNIAYRAAQMFFEAAELSCGADILLEKRIPHGAGLGGGSSDAAGVLKALNELLDKRFTDTELMQIGARLGADVPFFIIGGCALAEGIGEILTPLPECTEFTYVLAKPKESISTKFVYENLDIENRPPQLCVQAVAEGIRRGDPEMIYNNSGNILESVTAKEVPVIDEIKDCLLTLGAKISLMSGSGTTVFGVFEDAEQAAIAADEVKKFTDEVYIV